MNQLNVADDIIFILKPGIVWLAARLPCTVLSMPVIVAYLFLFFSPLRKIL